MADTVHGCCVHDDGARLFICGFLWGVEGMFAMRFAIFVGSWAFVTMVATVTFV